MLVLRIRITGISSSFDAILFCSLNIRNQKYLQRLASRSLDAIMQLYQPHHIDEPNTAIYAAYDGINVCCERNIPTIALTLVAKKKEEETHFES